MTELFRVDLKLEGIKEVREMLSAKLFKEILVDTIGNTAADAKQAVITEMRKVFDRPTPWILRGINTRIHRELLQADIWIEDFPTGRSQADILKPQIFGGTREMKRSEKYLRSYWVPGVGGRLNQYGNVPGSKVTQLLSRLGAFPEVGYTANIKRGSGRTREYFIPRPGSSLHPGVWERLSGRKIRPVLLFIQTPTYKIRLKFFDVIENAIRNNVSKQFKRAFDNRTRVGGMLTSMHPGEWMLT